MKIYVLILMLIISLSTFGQVTIGKLEFKLLGEATKPQKTMVSNLVVFEDNLTKKGKTIKLYIELLPAKNRAIAKNPIFILMGGPGQAASDLVSFFSTIFDELNENHDIVFVDQRGTGNSNPIKLDREYNNLQAYFDDAFLDNELLKRNLERLSSSNNLRHYGTLNAAIDIESVRKAMGYQSLNIYGTSYGTRLALTYLNKYPTKVRSLTLKGLVPPDLVIPNPFATDAQRSLDLLLKHCEENPICNTNFPDLSQTFDELFSRDYPISLKFHHPVFKGDRHIKLSKEKLVLAIRAILTSPTLTQSLPYLITQANEGNFQPLLDIIYKINKSYADGLYDAMMLCVICFEDYPRLSDTRINSNQETFMESAWMNRVKNACQLWNPEQLEAKKIKIKKRKVPALLISGHRDAATPPDYGKEMLYFLPKSKHLIVENGGHSFDRMLDCLEEIITDFIIKRNSSELETSCLEGVTLPAYRLE